MVKRRNRRRSAISILPDDILGDILCLASAEEQFPYTLNAGWIYQQRRKTNIGITRVSRRWRLTALERGTLWHELILRNKQDLTRTPWVLSLIPDRVALHVRIEPEMEEDVQEDIESGSTRRLAHSAELEKALGALETRAAQIHTLFAQAYAVAGFPALFGSGLSFPNLTSLEIDAANTVELEISTPKLRELKLTRIVPRNLAGWAKLFTPHLRTLSLESRYGTVKYGVGMLDVLFASCPLLKRLNIGLYCSKLEGAASIPPGRWKGHRLETLRAMLPQEDAMNLLAGLKNLSGIRLIDLALQTEINFNGNFNTDPLPLVQALTTGLTHVTSFDFNGGCCVKMKFGRFGSSTLPVVRNFSMVNSSIADGWDKTAIWRYLCTTFSAHRTVLELKVWGAVAWESITQLFAEVGPPQPDEGLTLVIEAGCLPNGEQGEVTPIMVLPSVKRVTFNAQSREEHQPDLCKLTEQLFASVSVQREAGPAVTEMCFCGWRRVYGESKNTWDAELDSVMRFVKDRGVEAMWTLCEEQRGRRRVV